MLYGQFICGPRVEARGLEPPKKLSGKIGPVDEVRKVAKFPEFFEFLYRILPRILLRISPNFVRIFCALFPGRWRPQKFHQKSPPFFNAKSPGKFEENIHKSFLESMQTKFSLNFLQKSPGRTGGMAHKGLQNL